MGRWGRRMFEGDSDLGLLADLENHVGIKEKGEHSMEDMIMMRMPDEKVKYVREKLGTSSYGETLLTNCKSKDLGWNGKHCTVILGAVMIAAGAHTSSENMQHLRKPVPQINCNTGYTMALFDEGFRAPGRPQFIAALDHYQPGIARSVRDLRCFYCGKIDSDIGRPLLKCGTCQLAWYCHKDCQRGHWKQHKPACGDPESKLMLNV